MGIRAWWRWRRDVAALRREVDRARLRWQRAYYAYQDAGVIFRGDRAGMSQVMDALVEANDMLTEYRELQARLKRMETVGS